MQLDLFIRAELCRDGYLPVQVFAIHLRHGDRGFRVDGRFTARLHMVYHPQ
jgi:hypothetical protein